MRLKVLGAAMVVNSRSTRAPRTSWCTTLKDQVNAGLLTVLVNPTLAVGIDISP